MSEAVPVKVYLDKTSIDESIKKVEKLNELLKEARTLADELTSVKLKITFSS